MISVASFLLSYTELSDFMKKKWVSIGIMVLLMLIAFEILTESSAILNSVGFSFNVWKNNIFPSLFPFFVLSEVLINYGFVELVGELFRPLMNKLFRLKGNCAFIFIMSIISGFPSNAKYTRELYLKGEINAYEASKILAFTHFSNPLFILGTVSLLFLNNKEVGFLILLCHYGTNLLIGLLFRGYHPSPIEVEPFSFKRAITKMHEKRLSNNRNFGEVITGALLNGINTLLLILGVVTMFLVITTIIDQNLSLSPFFQSLLNGFFEMTQGLKYISILALPLKLKTVFSVMILSFGGLSVHMQAVSILSDTKIKYFPFFVSRILHATIASLLTFFLFDWWISLF